MTNQELSILVDYFKLLEKIRVRLEKSKPAKCIIEPKRGKES